MPPMTRMVLRGTGVPEVLETSAATAGVDEEQTIGAERLPGRCRMRIWVDEQLIEVEMSGNVRVKKLK